MRRVAAQIRKELIQIVRDWRTLALAMVLPLVLLVLLSTAISLTVNDLPMAVQDYDNSVGIARIDCGISRVEYVSHCRVASG